MYKYKGKKILTLKIDLNLFLNTLFKNQGHPVQMWKLEMGCIVYKSVKKFKKYIIKIYSF